jgi:hypothetical protein
MLTMGELPCYRDLRYAGDLRGRYGHLKCSIGMRQEGARQTAMVVGLQRLHDPQTDRLLYLLVRCEVAPAD